VCLVIKTRQAYDWENPYSPVTGHCIHLLPLFCAHAIVNSRRSVFDFDFLGFNAYCFFEHAVLFREKWKTATTGKRRIPPGESAITGFLFLVLAVALLAYCFRHKF
jgi:hypothetical protein